MAHPLEWFGDSARCHDKASGLNNIQMMSSHLTEQINQAFRNPTIAMNLGLHSTLRRNTSGSDDIGSCLLLAGTFLNNWQLAYFCQ
jgi:hypothetical protein